MGRLKFEIISNICFLRLIRIFKNSMFEGHLPILISSDVEFLEEVFIKQSTCFSARKVYILLPTNNCELYVNMKINYNLKK